MRQRYSFFYFAFTLMLLATFSFTALSNKPNKALKNQCKNVCENELKVCEEYCDSSDDEACSTKCKNIFDPTSSYCTETCLQTPQNFGVCDNIISEEGENDPEFFTDTCIDHCENHYSQCVLFCKNRAADKDSQIICYNSCEQNFSNEDSICKQECENNPGYLQSCQ